jgi:WD40 repeat protein
VITPDGQSFIGQSNNGREVLELDAGTGTLTVVAKDPELIGFTVAPDGRSVYTTSLNKTAERWGIDGNSALTRSFRVAPPGDGYIVDSPGGNLVATLVGRFGNARVQVWNRSTGKKVGGPLNPGPGGAGWAAISPDGRLVAAPSLVTGHVMVWDIRTGRVVRQLAPPVDRTTAWVAFSPNSRLLATATFHDLHTVPPSYNGGWTYVWDLRSGRLVDSLKQGPKADGLSSAVFSPDSRRIFSVGDHGSVLLGDVAHNRAIRTWHTTDAYTQFGVFSPNGRVIATGGFGGSLITLWNADTGLSIHPPIKSSNNPIYPAGFYDGGRRLVVGRPGDVQLWDVPGRRLMGTLPVGGTQIAGATVTPDGRWLLTIGKPGLLTTWPLARAQWIADACRLANRQLTTGEWRSYLAGIPYVAKVCP